MKCPDPTVLNFLLPKQEGRNSVDADWQVASIIGMGTSGMTPDKPGQKLPKPA